MSNETNDFTEPLADFLVSLFRSHGVEAQARDGVVFVHRDESQWVRLTATAEANGTLARMHVDAAGPASAVVFDSWTGVGKDIESALKDAVQHFCLADFHVFLAGLWGLLEEDQVKHHVVPTDDGAWDLYLGPWVSRMSDPKETIAAPEAAFEQALVSGAPRLLTERSVRAGRVFVATIQGVITREALVDMQPNDVLSAILEAIPVTHNAKGYASQRLFFLAVPRGEGPTHTRVGRCTDSRSS